MKFISIEKISSEEAWKMKGIFLGFVLLSLLSLKFSPFVILHRLFPNYYPFKDNQSSCFLLNVFGIPCPFCGMSRAFTEFINLNFVESIYYNPSSVIFFTFLAVTCLTILILSFLNYKIIIKFNKKTFLLSLLVLLAIWTLNIFFGHH